MPEIKMKNTVKDIKILDKTSNLSKNMKNAYVRTKKSEEETQQDSHNNPQGYATDEVSSNAEYLGNKAINQADKLGRESLRKTPQNMRNIKSSYQNAKSKVDIAKDEFKKAKSEVKSAFNKSIKQTGKTANTTIKRSTKMSERTIKTTQTTAKTAQKAVQASKVAAKATDKAVVATVKAIIVTVKGLVALVAAGGWVAGVVILIICLVAMIAGSCFGIFFSGEDSGTGMTMQTAVSEINTEYQKKIDEIKSDTTFDVLEMSGTRAVWKEVLAIYAVKTTTDPKNGPEVASVDKENIKILKSIFWDMNTISSTTASKTETITYTSDDGNGNITETESEVTRKYLYITVTHKTADEMADKYKFSKNQREQLVELLSEEYAGMWSAVLYGISSGGNGDIVAVALSQLGNVGGQPYWSWYGFGGRVEWCACFISWVANECGYIESGIIPKFAACTPWFKERGQWQERDYEPRPGDIIFFDWDNSGDADHVGIVEKCENGIVYIIEGNSGDACKQREYPVGSNVIKGYGVPAY